MSKEYKIISGSAMFTGTFVKEVNKMLNDGWELQGGVSMAPGLLCQALTK